MKPLGIVPLPLSPQHLTIYFTCGERAIDGGMEK